MTLVCGYSIALIQTLPGQDVLPHAVHYCAPQFVAGRLLRVVSQ